MEKDVNSMTPDELRAEILRLRDKMRNDAIDFANKNLREVEQAKASFSRKAPEGKSPLFGR